MVALAVLPTGQAPAAGATGGWPGGIRRALDAAAALPEPLRRLVLPTTTATPTMTAEPTPTTTATATPTAPANGLMTPMPPFLTLRRPFDPPSEDRPSRTYPYGTTGGGAYLLHHGVDIGNPLGTTVVAVADGEVVYAGADEEVAWGPEPDFYGLLVVLKHELSATDTLYTLYGHLSRTRVEAGRRIREGDPIGEVGSTGIALGPHLHLEVRLSPRDYDSTRNPELYLAPSAGCGVVIATIQSSDGTTLANVPISLFRLGPDGAAAWFASSRTYPNEHVRPSDYWQENVVFGDVPAGEYRLATDAGAHTADLVVQAGLISRITLTLED